MTKGSFLNSFHLKLMMVALMVLDHVYSFIPGMPMWFHMLARVVAPVFAFLIAEGLIHTRNAEKYVSRLLWFGVATLAGNALLGLQFGERISNCILVTFALSAQAILCIEKWRGGDKKLLWPVAAAVMMFAAWFFEGSVMILGIVFIFYYLRGKVYVMCAAYTAFSLLVTVVLRLYGSVQWMMVFALIPILLYNGKRGLTGSGAGGFFLKYSFYLFYPLHIWVIYIIAHVAGFR